MAHLMDQLDITDHVFLSHDFYKIISVLVAILDLQRYWAIVSLENKYRHEHRNNTSSRKQHKI
jgi:hypothetical protein